MTVPIPTIFALGLWLEIPISMLNCVAFVQKRAIAVRLSVQNTIMTPASGVLRLAVVVPSPVVKWQWQWLNGDLKRFCAAEAVSQT